MYRKGDLFYKNVGNINVEIVNSAAKIIENSMEVLQKFNLV